MNIHLIFISIIEGLTEFLPISSTAHLIITSKFFHLDLTDTYIKFYLLFIQLGALLAGTTIFAKKLLTNKNLFTNVCISFIPSAILGFIFYKSFKHLLEGNILLMSLVLILGGLIFIFLERKYMRNYHFINSQKFELTKIDALIVGVAQAVAIIPGVSRSGATIIAGIFRKINKATMFEYTFVLALPTLGAAVLYDAYKSRDLFALTIDYKELMLGFIIAFISGAITLYILRKFLTKISLSFFGVYRIILGLLILFILY